jgi:hypothetical protein
LVLIFARLPPAQLCDTLVDRQDEAIANLKEDFREMLTKALERPKIGLDEDESADEEVCWPGRRCVKQ